MQEHLAVLLISSYLTLSFMYSVIEKVSQWKKTKSYYIDHFKGSFLNNHVPAAILLVVVIECISIGICLIGIYSALENNETQSLRWGLTSMAITLTLLMSGQRIAQDYSGAMNITVYFILTVIGIYVL